MSLLATLRAIVSAVTSIFGLIDRAAQAYHDKQTRKAERNAIELEGRKFNRSKIHELRDALDEPIDIDGLPDDFFADDDGGSAVGASLRFSDGTQPKQT